MKTTAMLLLLAAVPAMALNTGKTTTTKARHGAELNQQFARFDTNGDGLISRSEFPADAKLFDRFDANRDGAITRAEALEAVPDRASAERQLRGYDRNNDGLITRDEFPGNDNAFSRLDRNGDGVLSQADRGGKGKDHQGKGKNKSWGKHKGHKNK